MGKNQVAIIRIEDNMLNNVAEVTETISACVKIIEQYVDEYAELWAVIAALRSCEDWLNDKE